MSIAADEIGLGAGADSAAVGRTIRSLRKSKGLTIPELAMRLGRSVGFVSQVERGLSQASIQDLRAVAQVFDVPLSWFFSHDDAPAEERGYVVRAANRRTVGNSEAGLTEQLLSPDLGGAFEIVRSVFEPGAELANIQRRDTEEAGYVVSGALDLWIDGRWHSLAAGDSFRIDHKPHRWRNSGKDQAVAIWVISPPVY